MTHLYLQGKNGVGVRKSMQLREFSCYYLTELNQAHLQILLKAACNQTYVPVAVTVSPVSTLSLLWMYTKLSPGSNLNSR